MRRTSNSRMNLRCWLNGYSYARSSGRHTAICSDAYKIRSQEPDTSLYRPAIEAIKTSIKTSTSSMTAVPKPLKFLRRHYDSLTKQYEAWPPGDDKVDRYQRCVGFC